MGTPPWYRCIGRDQIYPIETPSMLATKDTRIKFVAWVFRYSHAPWKRYKKWDNIRVRSPNTDTRISLVINYKTKCTVKCIIISTRVAISPHFRHQFPAEVTVISINAPLSKAMFIDWHTLKISDWNNHYREGLGAHLSFHIQIEFFASSPRFVVRKFVSSRRTSTAF